MIIVGMKEIIEIKRKEFEVLEKMGEHSFKVQRKKKIFFSVAIRSKNFFPASFRKISFHTHTLLKVPKGPEKSRLQNILPRRLRAEATAMTAISVIA